MSNRTERETERRRRHRAGELVYVNGRWCEKEVWDEYAKVFRVIGTDFEKARNLDVVQPEFLAE